MEEVEGARAHYRVNLDQEVKIMGWKATEAYRVGDKIYIVHAREEGWVYGHTQNIGDQVAPFGSFWKMKCHLFDAEVESMEEYDLSRLLEDDA